MENPATLISAAIDSKNIAKLELTLRNMEVRDVTTQIYNCFYRVFNADAIDYALFNAFIQSPKINIDHKYNMQDTILHILCRNGQFGAIVDVVQKRKPNMWSKCVLGKTPLLVAAEYGQLEIMWALHNYGASLYHQDMFRRSAFHLAAMNGHLDCLKYLTDRTPQDVNIKNKNKDTPLMEAAYNGHDKCVEYLMRHGAFINTVNINGQHALMRAAAGGHLRCIDLLRNPSHVNLTDNFGCSAFFYAASNGNLPCLVHLMREVEINLRNRKGETPLMAASTKGNIEVVKYLVRSKARLNMADITGLTPLSSAAKEGHINVVKVLIQAGANIYSMDENRETALMKAKKFNHNDIVQLLEEIKNNPR